MVATSNENAAQTAAHPGGPASKKRKLAPSLPTPPASPAEGSGQRERPAKRAAREAITATTYVELTEDEKEQEMKQEREEASEPEDEEEDIIVPPRPHPHPQTGLYKMGALPEYRRARFAWQNQQKRREESKERHTAHQWRRHERF
jgi:hypothetical protein